MFGLALLPLVASAQTVSTQQQLHNTLVQLVALLTQELQALEVQLSQIQANASTTTVTTLPSLVTTNTIPQTVNTPVVASNPVEPTEVPIIPVLPLPLMCKLHADFSVGTMASTSPYQYIQVKGDLVYSFTAGAIGTIVDYGTVSASENNPSNPSLVGGQTLPTGESEGADGIVITQPTRFELIVTDPNSTASTTCYATAGDSQFEGDGTYVNY